ncbi:MAG: response regulator [Lachnospiraceae bacterium]|nr:response regulator [Lachnospiraceae bacterium]
MKTLLIVEDEKLIRQGIKTMVMRSGVPIEVIMECNNGEAALEILKQQKVDVMLTDIRMPKMDGIELVKRVQDLEPDHKPMVVAVSGFDDFSYAVEMLRNGVREYLLKPVERDKINSVLKKINDELENKANEYADEKKFGKQQLKYLLTNRIVTTDEMDMLKQKYAQSFFKGDYVVCCMELGAYEDKTIGTIALKDVDDGIVCVVETDSLEEFKANELMSQTAGFSGVHRGLENLKEAYEEAKNARCRAFCRGESVEYGNESKRIHRDILEQAIKLLDESECTGRLQLIGTAKTEEMIAAWEKLFGEVAKGRIEPDRFFGKQQEFLTSAMDLYQSVITDEDRKQCDNLGKFLAFAGLEQYGENFMNWVMTLHERVNSLNSTNSNTQKIKQAIEYIEENYNSDLNMAVVSNYISMNYSLFSYTFKQYTGTNFVNYLKDIRMREAKKLLTGTDMKIVEISQQVGYDNEKHFMKIFKSECGVSPSEYRKNTTR